MLHAYPSISRCDVKTDLNLSRSLAVNDLLTISIFSLKLHKCLQQFFLRLKNFLFISTTFWRKYHIENLGQSISFQVISCESFGTLIKAHKSILVCIFRPSKSLAIIIKNNAPSTIVLLLFVMSRTYYCSKAFSLEVSEFPWIGNRHVMCVTAYWRIANPKSSSQKGHVIVVLAVETNEIIIVNVDKVI